MPWIDLPATDETQWSRRPFLQQFTDAIRQRMVGGSDYFPDTPGWGGAPGHYNPSTWSYLSIPAVTVVGDYDDQATSITVNDTTNLKTGMILATPGIAEFIQIQSIVGNTIDVIRGYGMNLPTVELPDGSSLQPVRVTACDVQGFARIYQLQLSAEVVVQSFVKPSKIDHSTRSINFRGWMYTLAEARADAGIPPEGFTRKFPEGAGGVATDYGLMQAGDYIGPWIWNELRAMLDLCETRVYWPPEWWDPPLPRNVVVTSQSNGEDYGASETSTISLADAKVKALAAYAAGGGWFSGYSHAINLLNYYSWSPQFRARPSRARNHVTFWLWAEDWGTLDVPEPAMTIDHYVRPVAPWADQGGVFDAYGDGLLPGEWQQVLSGAAIEPGQDWYRSTSMWGSDPAVFPLPWPDDPAYGNSNIRGWVLDEIPSGVIMGTEHMGEFSLVSCEYAHGPGAV